MLETNFVRTLLGGKEEDALEQLEKINNVNVPYMLKGPKLVTYIMMASQQSTPAVIEALVAKGARTTDVDENGRNLLHIAQSARKVENVYKLIELDPSLRSKPDHQGNTPLHEVSNTRDYDMDRYLNGITPIEINSKNKLKETPLYLATHRSNSAVCIGLLEHAADPLIANLEGERACDILKDSLVPALALKINEKKALPLFALAAGKLHEKGLLSEKTIPQEHILTRALSAVQRVQVRAEEQAIEKLKKLSIS